MTCKNCVAKVKSELLKSGNITAAEVQLESPQATISMEKHMSVAELQTLVSKSGKYTVEEGDVAMPGQNWFATYKPLLLIGAYITGGTLLVEWVSGGFDAERWMMHFMAAFFLVFSFFKLLDLKGFADSYSSYDIIARNWRGWGYVYAFIELGLGLAYLTHFSPAVTNIITLVVMTVSLIGVIQAVSSRKTIRCACLGGVFNLPMSTVTIVEDGLMIAMSAYMLLA